MGFVSTFCPISGCSPIAAETLVFDDNIEPAIENSEREGAERLRNARAELVEEGGGERSELTVIGVINDDGHPVFDDANGSEDCDKLISDYVEDLKVVKGCISGDYFEFGCVEHPYLMDSRGRPETYLVSYGAEVMVMSWALPLLYLASNFRMNARRLWLLAMKIGRHQPHNHYVVPDVDYGLASEGIEQFLLPLVNWQTDDDEVVERLIQLAKEAENTEVIKQRLVHEGGYWVWMAGDVFPLSPSHLPVYPLVPSYGQISSLNPRSPALTNLPFDILSEIASFLPLPSLLSLASTTPVIRQRLLGSPSSRSQTAREWLANAGRCWLPLKVDLGISSPRKGAIPRLNDLPKPIVSLLGLEEGDNWWNYLQRCAESGSMKNRRRVWKVVEGIERKAKDLGI
ncbi:hypothetical protein JCM5353_004937 [Sporobolomyces roseus]